MSTIPPSESPNFEEFKPTEHHLENTSTPCSSVSSPAHTTDSMKPVTEDNTAKKNAEAKAAKRKELKEEADSILEKLKSLKKLAASLPTEKSPALKALIQFEVKIDLILSKIQIIREKTVKMNEDIVAYDNAMQQATNKLNQAINTYNNVPFTTESSAAYEAALQTYMHDTEAAENGYIKSAGVYNAFAKSVPALNSELAALGLPKISPLPAFAPIPLQIYIPSSSRPISPLLDLPSLAQLPEVSAPPSKEAAVQTALGDTIDSLLNSLEDPLNIQKHMHRHV